MYARDVDGETLTFGVDGSLIYNSLVMYDRESGSLLSQFLGRALDGPHRGSSLEFVPSALITWGAWKSERPDTLLLDAGGRMRPYEEYRLDPDIMGAYGETNVARRFASKDVVVSVRLGGEARAYAIADVVRAEALDDAVGGVSIAVFERVVGGRVVAVKREAEPIRLVDAEPGAVWSALGGRAPSAPTRGGRVVTLKRGAEPLRLVDAETGAAWSALDGRGPSAPTRGVRLRMPPGLRTY